MSFKRELWEQSNRLTYRNLDEYRQKYARLKERLEIKYGRIETERRKQYGKLYYAEHRDEPVLLRRLARERWQRQTGLPRASAPESIIQGHMAQIRVLRALKTK